MRAQTVTAPSDFSLLTLCMALVCKVPVDREIPLPTQSLYALLKSFVALLEAMGTISLEMLQCRLLLTIFEIGHAMYPSAYISTAANIRAAVTLGIGATCEDLRKVFPDPQKAEEARQTWRGIVITDRYASLESGQAPNTPHGRCIDTVGGNRDSEDWAQVEMDSFTKLAHASRLLDQVLVHVHATLSHPLFNEAEAVQILKSLTSFLMTFQSGDENLHPLSDSALALCRRLQTSAMLEILEVGSHMDIHDNECCIYTSLNILKSLVHEIARGNITTPIERATLVSGAVDPEPSIRPLKSLLGYLAMRWVAAKHYLAKIETAQETCNL
ncbi:hypothetical protein EYZ11_000347 [Aspergillus tanneri]|uniref:Xylanolytic transcriptional activator regulatory domain-containing protein n=1 Tax=Aspergillus tanneri TaxID=1220188 RepID=A0A4S3JXD6_9EURO|nr:hypothetical protein EYZ11_000347 [Aspergillus tanneri]